MQKHSVFHWQMLSLCEITFFFFFLFFHEQTDLMQRMNFLTASSSVENKKVSSFHLDEKPSDLKQPFY